MMRLYESYVGLYEKSESCDEYEDVEKEEKGEKEEEKSESKGKRNKAKDKKEMKESNDLYDLVLDYLLGEGLCESVENAEIMIAHMSEGWVDAIVESYELDEANRAEKELGLSSRERTRARNLQQNLGGPVFYKKRNTALGDRSSSKFNTANKRLASNRQAEHEAGRHTRGDVGLNSRNRYQANKDHADGYPSIVKRGEGPS